MRHQQSEFAEFYTAARDDCLRAVLASTGDWQAAEECVAEAFARAWASWRTVRAHPAPRAWVVRTALNQSVSRWRRRRREVPLGSGADRAAPAGGLSKVDAEILSLPQEEICRRLIRHAASLGYTPDES